MTVDREKLSPDGGEGKENFSPALRRWLQKGWVPKVSRRGCELFLDWASSGFK